MSDVTARLTPDTSSFTGMLLRYFVNFYDMEIIEEEAFLAWKEDITQEFPGKGKALFQVNANSLLAEV